MLLACRAFNAHAETSLCKKKSHHTHHTTKSFIYIQPNIFMYAKNSCINTRILSGKYRCVPLTIQLLNPFTIYLVSLFFKLAAVHFLLVHFALPPLYHSPCRRGIFTSFSWTYHFLVWFIGNKTVIFILLSICPFLMFLFPTSFHIYFNHLYQPEVILYFNFLHDSHEAVISFIL